MHRKGAYAPKHITDAQKEPGPVKIFTKVEIEAFCLARGVTMSRKVK